MVEVKNAQAWGAETVFFSDDNFVVNRKFTVALLKEIIAWNRTLARPLSFSTQATIMIGEDDELVKLLADARFSVIFLGLETINKDCLYEVNKGEMARYDPFQVIPRLSSHGIVPFSASSSASTTTRPPFLRKSRIFSTRRQAPSPPSASSTPPTTRPCTTA